VRSSRTTVLVADDNESIRSVIAEALRRSGFDVVEAADGAVALRLARERRPAAIVLDVVMPELDGIEVLRALRQEAPTRDIPVLIVSGESGPRERRMAAALGASEVIEKPFQIAELVQRIGPLIAASKEPAFDLENALALLGGDAALFAEIVDLLRTERAKAMVDLRRALAAKDSASIARIAHSLKGAVAAVAAGRARDLSAKLEVAAKAGELEDAPDLAVALEAELARLEDELVHATAELRPTPA
jgi:CheY-like chemotaxis protein